MPDSRHDLSGDPDPTIERIASALRPLPDVDPEARARVLVAVAAERARGASSRPAGWRRAVLPAAVAATVVIAVAAGVLMTREPRPDGIAAATAAGVPPTADAPATLASAAADEPARESAVPVELVVRSPHARRVAVVGDFTGWDAGRIAMSRDPASGLWSATVMVRPGRHVYAFVIDDTVWLRDPRAPVANDADFGRPGSLLLVGRP